VKKFKAKLSLNHPLMWQTFITVCERKDWKMCFFFYYLIPKLKAGALPLVDSLVLLPVI